MHGALMQTISIDQQCTLDSVPQTTTMLAHLALGVCSQPIRYAVREIRGVTCMLLVGAVKKERAQRKHQ